MTDQPPIKPVRELLTTAADYLEGKGVQESRVITELLLGCLLHCKRLELLERLDEPLGARELAALRRGVKRVAEGEPVQYVLGRTEFMGHSFKTDRRALIPRPETEVLVEQVLACAELWGGGPDGATGHKPAIVDLGTGSGCIVISLALTRPEAFYVGVDPSTEALELARENALALGVADRTAFAAGDLADCVDPGSLNAILANLPYVPTAEYERLPRHIRDHEPRTALDGGPDGLRLIEEAVQDAAMALGPNGRLFLEIGEDQASAVTAMLGDTGFDDVTVAADLAGRDRIVTSRLPPATSVAEPMDG